MTIAVDLGLKATKQTKQNNVVCATSKASDQPAHMCSLIRAFASRLNILTLKLLTEHHLEFLSLKGGCIGLYESTLVKMPHCWKSHVVAQINKLQLIRVEVNSSFYVFHIDFRQ